MHLHPKVPRLRSMAVLAMSIGLGSVASFALVTDASAHADIVSGSAVCQTNGTYTITWTVQNDWNLSETVALVSNTAGGVFTGVPVSVLASGNGSGGAGHTPYASNTFTETGVPGSTTTASVTVKGTWSDKATATNSGNASLRGTCVSPSPSPSPSPTITPTPTPTITPTPTPTITPTPTPTITPTPSNSIPPPPPGNVLPAVPTLTQGACVSGTETSAFYTIPGITGVTYQANGVAAAVGTHTVAFGSTTTVTAAPTGGYTFPAATVTSWTLVANAALPSCATPSPSVLGITFNQPPPAKTPPSATLPFTGMPLIGTVVAGIGLLLGGLLLVGSSRRHRNSQLTWIDQQ
jgi:hypothetical protein